MSNPWNLRTLLCRVKDVIKLRILRGAYPGFSDGPKSMTNVLITDTQRTDIEEAAVCLRGRDWSDTATSPGMPTATRNWKRQGKSPSASAGSAALLTP